MINSGDADEYYLKWQMAECVPRDILHFEETADTDTRTFKR